VTLRARWVTLRALLGDVQVTGRAADAAATGAPLAGVPPLPPPRPPTAQQAAVAAAQLDAEAARARGLAMDWLRLQLVQVRFLPPLVLLPVT
jgi:hypothetical protein